MMADIGEVNCFKLEPELVVIKEEPINDSTNEFLELPVKIKEEPEVNSPSDGGSGQTSCWSPVSVKEELIDDVTVEELDDAGSVDPLGGCSDTETKFEASVCSESNRFLEMGRASEEKKPHDACDLKDHLKIHTGERPHVCDICGFGFKRITHLKVHMRTHTGERPYVCDICGLGFITSFHLKYHKRTHSGERPCVCDICGKGFTTSSHLTNHKKTHTEERPHACDICGLGFKRITHLSAHTRTHTGEKPYVCDICGMGFKQVGHLKTHTKIHTKTL